VIKILLYFLPGIVLLGILTSYEDIKFGKIRNKYIIFGLAYAIITYCLLITIYSLNNIPINTFYLVEVLTNTLIALLIGFVIWHIGFWTAGDAKLFLAYAALVPLSVYTYGYVKYFPSITLLINMFVPVSLFLFLLVIFKTSFKQKKESLISILTPKRLGSALVALFAIFWIIKIIFSLINLESYFLMLILSLILFFSLKRFFKKKFVAIAIIISVLRLIIDRSVYSIEFVKQFLVLFIIWIILRSFILNLGSKYFIKDIKITDLKEGMIPIGAIYEEKEKKKKVNISSKKEPLFKAIPEGLREEEVKKIKNLYFNKKLQGDTIKIKQTVPFATFIFLGVILTILCKGNSITFIRNIILGEIDLGYQLYIIIAMLLILVFVFYNFSSIKKSEK